MNTEVLYIAGVPRSGSTLIGKILGQPEGMAYTGELLSLDAQFRDSGLCGCGELLSNCPRWSQLDASEDLLYTFDRIGHSVRVRNLFFGASGINGRVERVAEVYNEIRTLFDGSTIIDSSKFPSYLHILTQSPGVEVKVLHLIRDPRAVVYSWWKRPLENKSRNPGLADMTFTDFKFMNPIRWGVIWTEWNYLIRRIWGGKKNYHFIKYEDFCQSPRGTIAQAIRDLDIGASPQWESEKTIELSSHHSVKGNPNRFTSGLVEIEERTEWKEKMSRSVRTLTTLLALPKLHEFGYRAELF